MLRDKSARQISERKRQQLNQDSRTPTTENLSPQNQRKHQTGRIEYYKKKQDQGRRSKTKLL